MTRILCMHIKTAPVVHDLQQDFAIFLGQAQIHPSSMRMLNRILNGLQTDPIERFFGFNAQLRFASQIIELDRKSVV